MKGRAVVIVAVVLIAVMVLVVATIEIQRQQDAADQARICAMHPDGRNLPGDPCYEPPA